MNATIEIRPDLLERLQSFADEQHTSVDQVLESLLGQAHNDNGHHNLPQPPDESGLPLAYIFDLLINAVIVINPDREILFYNQGAETIFGYDADEILGEPVDRLIPERYRSIHARHLAAFTETSESVRWMKERSTIYGLRKDGSEFPAEASISRVEHNGELFLTVVLQDVHERQQLENALKTSEQQYRSIVQDQTELICRYTPDFVITFANETYRTMMGVAESDVGVTSFTSRINPAEREAAINSIKNLTSDNPLSISEHQTKLPDGSWRWIQWKDRAILNDAGEIVEFQGVGRDITEQKVAEALLKESERRYAQAELVGQFGHWERDLIGDTDVWSPGIFRILGISLEESGLDYERFLQYVHPADRSRVIENMDTALRMSHAVASEFRIRRATGEERIIYAIESAKRDSAGEPTHVVGTMIDITEHRRLEERALLYEAAVEATAELIIVVSPDYEYLLVNQHYLNYHQLSREDIVGHTLAEILGEEFLSNTIRSRFDRCLAGETQNFEAIFNYPTLGTRNLLVTYSPMRDQLENITGVVVVMRDITERTRVQEALRENEQKLKTLFDVLPVGISILNDQGRIVEVNQALEKILDLTLPELVAGKYRDRRYIRPDHNPMEPHEFPSARSIQESRPVKEVEIGVVKEDNQIIWTSVSAAPLPLPGLSTVLVTTDISERKEMETQKIALRLEQERNSILARFIQNASHEFRTPLAIMRSNISLALRHDDPEKRASKLQEANSQIDIVLQLIDSLMILTRLESAMVYPKASCDVNKVLQIHYALNSMATEREDLKIDVKFGDQPAVIDANKNDLILAVSQITSNALRYTPPGGSITVWTELHSEQFFVIVQDTGVGMTPEVKNRMFERFYRMDTARTTRGFGLGLPIAQKIIELHGGEIHVESAPDQGTTVKVMLPLA